MIVTVLGGCGFVGSHVVDRLVGSCEKVYVVDDLSTCVLDQEGAPVYLNAVAELVEDVPPQTEVILNLACRYPLEREVSVWFCAYNGFVVRGVNLVRQLAVYRNLKKYVIGSTLDVYHPQGKHSGFASLASSFRQAVRYWHRPPILDVEVVHMPDVYGPRSAVGCPFLPQFGPSASLDKPYFKRLAYVGDVADMLADRCTDLKHRLHVDYVAEGWNMCDKSEVLENLLPVVPNVHLKGTSFDEGINRTFEYLKGVEDGNEG